MSAEFIQRMGAFRGSGAYSVITPLIQKVLRWVRLCRQLVHEGDVDNSTLLGICPTAQASPNYPRKRITLTLPA